MNSTYKTPHVDALIFDLDGTAFPVAIDGMPNKRIIEAVSAANKKVYVAVATGRTLHYCEHLLSALQIAKPSIINGGTEIYDPKLHKRLWIQSMSEETVREVIGYVKKLPFKISSEYDVDPISPEYFSFRPDVAKIVLFAVPQIQAERITREISAVSGAVAHYMGSWTPGLCDIHVTHELATKKHAMQALLSHANLNHERVMVVGDGGNDLPLFELSGWKVAMGNADDRLKKAANWIAPSVEEDGLAAAIDRFILRHGR